MCMCFAYEIIINKILPTSKTDAIQQKQNDLLLASTNSYFTIISIDTLKTKNSSNNKRSKK